MTAVPGPGGGPPGDGHLDDGRISALIDGEATGLERSHLDDCRSCADRLAAWQQALARVGALELDPPQPDPARRESAVDAAMAARPRPTVWWRLGGDRLRPLLAAAALVLVAGAAVAGVVGARSGHPRPGPSAAGAASPTSAAAFPGTRSSGAASEPGPVAGGSPAADQPSAASGVPVRTVELGTVPGSGALASRLGELLSSNAGGSGTSKSPSAFAGAAGGVARCPAPGPPSPLPAGSPLVLIASADYQSVPADVFVYQAGSRHDAVVERASDCATVAVVGF